MALKTALLSNQLLAQAHVRELGPTRIGDENIVRLQVPVHDATLKVIITNRGLRKDYKKRIISRGGHSYFYTRRVLFQIGRFWTE